jgi:catechol 2,3-dioxygenase-like lactoylglutathione lyase family enzyme
MARITKINHVTLIVDQLEKAAAFYEHEMGLEPIAAFVFDYPTAFFKINDEQQLHLTEWEDSYSFRGHLCVEVDDFNAIFWRAKELGIIDTEPWGKVRQLPDGAMQMFLRDPAGNLVEISSNPAFRDQLDPAIFQDELFAEGLYVSGRNDFRGYKAENATLYHGKGGG